MAHGPGPGPDRCLSEARRRRERGDLDGVEQKANLILIDERKGYKVALRLGLHAVTTLGVLEEASYRGPVDLHEVIERLDKQTKFYVTGDVLAEYERRIKSAQGPARRDLEDGAAS